MIQCWILCTAIQTLIGSEVFCSLERTLSWTFVPNIPFSVCWGCYEVNFHRSADLAERQFRSVAGQGVRSFQKGKITWEDKLVVNDSEDNLLFSVESRQCCGYPVVVQDAFYLKSAGGVGIRRKMTVVWFLYSAKQSHRPRMNAGEQMVLSVKIS